MTRHRTSAPPSDLLRTYVRVVIGRKVGGGAVLRRDSCSRFGHQAAATRRDVTAAALRDERHRKRLRATGDGAGPTPPCLGHPLLSLCRMSARIGDAPGRCLRCEPPTAWF